ncbi:unnamed protein product [Tuber melanosporum]|uniref:(Perigord truffle) hypothetical protein n=1 Tax=Tuber melanosporum (strain Mel28) TaxID=656061 RepID=D5GNH0_TUBMM|nr:uncharacterized protein GSTUM_00011287001 [Tuber melanosporum]CAZ86063.1 unnamed protein product [Tuber melanosporum]
MGQVEDNRGHTRSWHLCFFSFSFSSSPVFFSFFLFPLYIHIHSYSYSYSHLGSGFWCWFFLVLSPFLNLWEVFFSPLPVLDSTQ